MEQAIILANLDANPSQTDKLQIHGYHQHPEIFGEFEIYGSDAPELNKLVSEKTEYRNKLHPDYDYVQGEVIWAVRYEMARNIEDFLARRRRLLFLDAKASIKVAPIVAKSMAQELGYGNDWERAQVAHFTSLARNYLLTN